MFTLIEIIAALWYIATAVGWLFIFPYVGEKRWKALIPFYGQYTKFKLAGNKKSFIAHAVLIVFLAFFVMLTYGMYITFLVDADNQRLAKNLMFVFALAWVIGFIINALLHYFANKKIVERLYGTPEDASNMSFLPCIYVPLFAINTCTGYSKRHNTGIKTRNNTNVNNRFRRLD